MGRLTMPRHQKITPIMCNTLGPDDAQMARDLLKIEDKWQDPAPVDQAEKWLAHWLDLKQVFGFMGGRAALYAIAKAMGLSKGDEVIIPGLTCQVVVNAFEYNGATCVHADIERDTFNMDVQRFAEKITPKTRAVLLQHTFGVPARDTLAILAMAKSHGIMVIEDVAHGLGGRLLRQKLGTFGDVAFFSTERTKMINTIHGGFAATSNPAILKGLKQVYDSAGYPSADKIKDILNTLLFCYYTKVHKNRVNRFDWARKIYGQNLIPQMTDLELLGKFEPMYACKMPGPIGALALNQLKKFETFIPLRQAAARKWEQWAVSNGYGISSPADDSYCTWLRYPVIVPEHLKTDTSWIEKDLAMEPGVWFQTPCHPNNREIFDIPIGWEIARTVVNLPTGLWID
ncbi:MAG: aminotransferase class I/II-fold pyridoxal phosphate-dependent enzyme [Desulfobacter sp.]|nr:MAG: aminotransferase class I/II-fold pyridoxal phosphate-dependent enzyme [Desulfobacter sp.]